MELPHDSSFVIAKRVNESLLALAACFVDYIVSLDGIAFSFIRLIYGF